MNVAFPHIIGVLNVTPDSFHDGGKFTEVGAALQAVEQMLKDGADIIDVGGESTGPNSRDVSVEAELQRVVPVVQAIRKAFPNVQISVDTYKSAVARVVIEEGAMMINDVTAGRGDPELLAVVAKSSAKIVLMFAKDSTPRTTVAQTQYDDVITTVKTFLKERRQAAIDAGIDASHIILDPGLGHFLSSDPRYSFQMIARLSELLDLGAPLYLSPSRKSFVAGAEELKTPDRLPGTVAASAIAVLHGATYIRTHDVKEVRRGCEVGAEIRKYL